jgi:hypothetical protein
VIVPAQIGTRPVTDGVEQHQDSEGVEQREGSEQIITVREEKGAREGGALGGKAGTTGVNELRGGTVQSLAVVGIGRTLTLATKPTRHNGTFDSLMS